MAITVRNRDGVTILDVSGAMRLGSEDVELRRTLRSRLDAGDVKFLFNFKKVSYMDSAAIGETVACHKRAAERGGVIKLLMIPKGRPDELFRIASLDRVFEIFRDEDEAIASFGA